MSYQIAVLVGSLRRESYNRTLAKALVKLGPADFSFTFLEIGTLPLYNQDDDPHQSEPVKRLKNTIRAAQGVLVVSPEYNRSIPAVLKNAIDHASRPPGDSAWPSKPLGLMGIAPGAIGTAMMQQHLRNVFACLDAPVMGQPEMFLQMKEGFFTEDGSICEASREFLQRWMDRFVAWVKLHNK